MKFIKLTEGWFNKFHMKWPCVRSSIYHFDVGLSPARYAGWFFYGVIPFSSHLLIGLQFQRSFSETAWQIKSKLYVE